MVKTKQYQHQKECLEYSKTHNSFLLADQMGLGKTKEAIDIAVERKHDNNYKHCLIICGVNGLKWNWEEEIYRHSYECCTIIGKRKGKSGSNANKLEDLQKIDNLPYFLITNVESLRYKVKTGNQVRKRVNRRMKMVDEYVYPITDLLIEYINQGKINMIVADEIHVLKNPDSEICSQFLRLDAESKLAMTGTPLMNSPLDLFVILKWLGYEDHSFWQFKTHYCKFGGFNGYEVVGYKNVDQIQNTLDKMMLRRLKEEVLDLPDKVYHKEFVEMTTKQSKIYYEILTELRKNIDKIIASNNPLSQLIRLRQATGYTGILSSVIQESAKLERLYSLCDEIIKDGEKVVIFSNWKEMVDVMTDKLKEFNPLVITGNTKDVDRQSIINQFQSDNDSKVIIGTTGALGTGVTLTSANNVIFYDIPWTNASFQQAVDRCHRIGQNQVVNIYEIICKGTIDERVHEIVKMKGQLSDEIIDTAITKEEIVDYLMR